MNKIIFSLLVISLFSLAACVTDGKKTSSTTTEATADNRSQADIDDELLRHYAEDKQLDVKKTASGLYYIVHEAGAGPNYKLGQPCKAHYTGYTLDGKIFDSSYKRNQPLAFNVGQMIPGWNEALQFLNAGSKVQLLIPSSLAYGSRGFPGLINPNTPLVFDIELLAL